MSKIWVQPTGKLISGHVLDCAKGPLERALKQYDPLLYLQHNPRKNRGYGTWELRRRPETKTVVDIVEFQGAAFVKIEWHENNFINHVKDFPYLNYSIVEWLKTHDTWNAGVQRHNVVELAEKNLDQHHAAQAQKNAEMLKYNLKQYRKEWKDLKEFAQQAGSNLGDIALHWGQAGKR